MSRKKPKRRRPLLLLLLVLMAAVFLLRFGGGEKNGEEAGAAGREPAAAEKPRPAESALSQSPSAGEEEPKNSAAELWEKLFPHAAPKETPTPADPVPTEALAAWCAAQSGQAGFPKEPAAEAAADWQSGENGLPAAENGGTAGFPGVLVFRYLPPSEKDGFRALLLAFGTEPVSITGKTSREFCEKAAMRLDALAGPEGRSYTRFYALDTACAGPSQAEWLYENVKKRFPRILYTGQPTLSNDENGTP